MVAMELIAPIFIVCEHVQRIDVGLLDSLYVISPLFWVAFFPFLFLLVRAALWPRCFNLLEDKASLLLLIELIRIHPALDLLRVSGALLESNAHLLGNLHASAGCLLV